MMNRINWMQTGKDHWENKKAEILSIIKRIDWQELKGKITLAFTSGEGIKAIIKDFGIPKVSHIAISNELAPYSLYGIYGHYKNAHVKAYFIDEGSHISSLCQEVEEIEPVTV